MPATVRMKGRAIKRRVPCQMTQTERLYADRLNLLIATGDIVAWWYEPEALRLAKSTSYLPDFRVVLPDGTIEFHEVKGTAGYKAKHQDKGRVKIKVAAEIHWIYRFRVAIRLKANVGGGWSIEDIEPR